MSIAPDWDLRCYSSYQKRGALKDAMPFAKVIGMQREAIPIMMIDQ